MNCFLNMQIIAAVFLVLPLPFEVEAYGTTGGAIMDNEMRFTIKELEDHSFRVSETVNNVTTQSGYSNFTELAEEWIIPYFEDKGIRFEPEPEPVTCTAWSNNETHIFPVVCPVDSEPV